jgi:hypothetical protein
MPEVWRKNAASAIGAALVSYAALIENNQCPISDA